MTTRLETEHNIISVEDLSFQEQKTQRLEELLSQERKNVEAIQSLLQQASLKQATLQRERNDSEEKLKNVCQ